MKKNIVIGSRGSKLALWQSEWTKSMMLKYNPDITIDIQIIKTKGDKILDVPLAKIGDAGLFVKEIEDALINKKVDLAVHSLKDMPALVPEGLEISTVPVRQTPNDVLISNKYSSLSDLPIGATVGTSSLRRISQLLSVRPDLQTVPIRGNLDTRLKKLETENLDAIILAAAGLIRLGFQDLITEYLDLDLMVSAVGQGALCIETRKGDTDILKLLKPFNCEETKQVVFGERSFLKELKGGCQVPIAAHGFIDNGEYVLTGLVAELDGKTVLKESVRGKLCDSVKMGIQLAESLVSKGAGTILEKIKANAE